MKKLLISITILSLLWVSFSNLRKPKDNSLRQSTDLPVTLSIEDEQSLLNSSTMYGYASKGEWLKCSKNRKKNSCEDEQPYLATYGQFLTALSNNSVCTLYLKAFDAWKDDDRMVVPAYTLCFFSREVHDIVITNTCFQNYYNDLFITCANY